MAVRDGAVHLVEALDSLAAQTYADYELVVVDDGSSDSTSEILADRAAQDRRVRIVRNERSRGLPTALNLGLSHCGGALIARADADDVYAPHRLALQMDHLRGNPQIGVLGSSYRRISEDGEVVSIEHPPLDDMTIRARQHFSNCLLHPSVIFRANLVRSVGGYDERYWTAQDTDLWVRVRDRTRFANLSELLVDYRLHDRSTMRKRGAAGRALSLSVPQRMLSQLLGRSLERHEVAAAIRLFQAFEQVVAADLQMGVALLIEALNAIGRVSPSRAAASVRREAALSCLKQLVRYHRRDPAASATLMRAVLGLDPAVAFRSPFREALLRKLTG